MHVTLLAGCQKYTSGTSEINFAIAQMPQNLDPRYATDAASERVNRLLYQPLVDFDAVSKPSPILARSDVLNDKTYRFVLNNNIARFHNGAALTAADVKATYDSFAVLKDSPHTAEFSNIDSIQVEDKNTVLFQLKQPDSHFVEKLIIGILPKNLIENSHDFSHKPIGNGPLKLVNWQNKLSLQRVKDGQIINLQEVKDPTVRVLKLLRGEADLIQGDLPPELVKHLQNKHEVLVKTSIGANYSYLGLNMQDPVLKQLKVRQAIAYAINRQAIIDKVMVQNSRIADSILPPEHYTNLGAHLLPYDYNPALSKKLLLEAGVKLPLKLTYKTSTDAQRVRFATILQAQMAAAGIDLTIKSLDWGTFFADVKQGHFQLFGLTWVGIKTPEIYAKAFGSQHFPPSGFNRGRYADAELDALLADENWPAATARIHQQLPYIPLWFEGQFAAMQKNIIHYSPKADGNWDDLEIIKRN
ncbi:MAG: ABC transporter substrate-binding protein [Bdellovibrio sp.]|nr:ABC transporter substrate-binding protein [Methylotenera sp.]